MIMAQVVGHTAALLLMLFSLLSATFGQMLGELQVETYTVSLTGMEETKRDDVQWTFRTPPAEVCLYNLTLLTIEGEDKRMMAFQWSCDVIILHIVMDKAVRGTTIAYPLPLIVTKNARMVTVLFQRYRRTIQLRIQDGDKMASRLTGSNSDFVPRVAKLTYHPLVCMQSVTYNDLNLQGNTAYPSCGSNSYSISPVTDVSIYNGDVLNVSSVLPMIESCYITTVSQLLHGLLISNTHLLYKHDGTLNGEVVSFYITCREDNSQTLLALDIIVNEARLTARVKEMIVKERTTTMSSKYLNVTRTSVYHSLPCIVNYTLQSYTTHGSLSLHGSQLRPPHVFNQAQLQFGELIYAVAFGDQAFEEVIDLVATAVGAPSISIQLTVLYEPSLEVRLRRLNVVEGHTAVLSNQTLTVSYGVSHAVHCEILMQPRFGKVIRSLSVPQIPLRSFSGQDIVNESLVYIHDGSETSADSITLGISPAAFPSLQQIAVFEIAISLANDNTPTRNSSATLHVVDGMNTFLSSEDLSYVDADIDQSYGDITIESQQISCGEIVRRKWHGEMSRFTQRDLGQGQVIFHHFGGNTSCDLPVTVSDGSHALSEVIEIVPVGYKQEVSGTLSMNVSRNGESVLDSQVLSVASNTNVPTSDIVIVVKRLPLHGVIKSANDNRFTYQEVLDKSVTYSHLGTLSVSDTFLLKVKIDGLVRNLVIKVAIDTDADLLKPVVLRNFAIAGRVGTTVEITNSILDVQHRLAHPSELLYQVPSRLGQRFLEFSIKRDNGTYSDTSFTQGDVNAGRVFYNMQESSRPSTLLVSFRGVSTDLVFSPVLLTGDMTAQVMQSLSVVEGSVSIIQEMFITSIDSSFTNDLLSVAITRPAPHIDFFYNYTVEVNTFTQADILSGLISLRHDGAEGSFVTMKCKLKYPNAESEEKEVTIDVVPLNDHYPSFNATGELLPPVIYIGENCTLTNQSLLIKDPDSDSTALSLTYRVVSPQQAAGRILRFGGPATEFTQLDVNNLEITFEHLGRDRSTGIRYIHLNISDGFYSRHSVLVMKYLEKNVEVYDRVYKVFPTIPHPIATEHMQPQLPRGADLKVTSETAYGSVGEIDKKNTNSKKLFYVPSKDMLPKLCKNIFDFFTDKVTLTTISNDPSLVETSTFLMNISFLNIDEQSVALFDIVTSELIVTANSFAAVSEDTISAAGLAHHFSVCNSMVRLGFLVTRFPQHCTISGLQSKFVLWWDKISSAQYSVSCPNGLSIDPLQQFVIKIALQQNKRLWVVEQFEFIVPIRIDLPPLQSIERLACPVSMLQGYNYVTFTQDLVKCLGHKAGLDTQLAVTSQPAYGDVLVDDLSSQSLTLRDMTNGKVRYMQSKLAKLDWFELSQQQIGLALTAVLRVVINVAPNIVSSSSAVVMANHPIVLTTELLDASPLLELSLGEATYWITKSPSFGSLVKSEGRSRRDVLDHFTHTDITEQIILYYPPDILPDAGEDNFSYTLKSPGVQPADGVFTVIFNQSNSVSTPSISKVLSPDYHNYDEPVITIVVVSSCVSVCVITILVTVLCLRKVQTRRRKHLARQERINSEPRLILTRENGSYKLLVAGGDEFPATTYTSPSSPMRQIDGERTCEISATVPQVRVTPLIDKDGTIYDLHDYVNCEDLPCPTPRATEEPSSRYGSLIEEESNGLYHSIERLPPIRKPNYSC